MAREAFQVRDENFDERVRNSFSAQGLMNTLGAEITLVELGFVEIRMPFTDGLSQQHGFFHAGGLASIVDSAGGYAASTLFAAEDGVLTVEFKVNLISPADGDLLIAQGEVIKPGRTLTITTGNVFVEKAGERRHCAVMQQTLMRIVGNPDVTG